MISSTIILNGKLQLVLTGGSAIETELLKSLFVGPTEGTMHDKIVIGDKQLVDSVVIVSASANKLNEQ